MVFDKIIALSICESKISRNQVRISKADPLLFVFKIPNI